MLQHLGRAAPSAESEQWALTRSCPWTAVFAVGVLLLSTGAFFALQDGEDASSPVVLMLWTVAYLIAATGLLDSVLRRRMALHLPTALTCFVVLALLSFLWSVAPAVTLRRSVALAGTLAVGLLLAQRLQAVDVLEAVRRASVIVAVASLLLYAAGDPRVLDDVHQTLRGVLATKNTLGRVMAIGLVATAAVVLLDRRRWRRCLWSALPMCMALALTDSAGGVVVAVLGCAVVGVAALWRSDGGKSAAPAALSAALGMLLVLLPAGLTADRLLGVTGRDATLTGRTDIWAESLLAAAERPLLGSGFGAFWSLGSGEGSEAAVRIAARLQESVAHAHNGLLDIALGVGLVGVVLAVLVLAGLIRRGVRDLRAGRSGPAALRLGVSTLVIVATAAESGLLQENALLTVLLAVAAGEGPTAGPRRSRASPAGEVSGSTVEPGPDSPDSFVVAGSGTAGAYGLPPAEGRGGVRDHDHGGGQP